MQRAREAWDRAGQPSEIEPAADVAVLPISRETRDQIHELAKRQGASADAMLLYALVACWDVAALAQTVRSL